jgi:porin
MKSFLLIVLIFLFATFSEASNHKSNSDSLAGNQVDNCNINQILILNAGYICDFAGNMMGGKSKGTVFLGKANIDLSFTTQNIGLWRGGEFFFNGAATHGQSPTEKLTGDFQVISNIDAGGDYIFIQEFWYKQSFNAFDLTIGLQDLNASFVSSDNSGMFINSSFGIASVISANVPTSIFPLTTLGVIGKLSLSESIDFRFAVFDGKPTSFSENKYNASWKLKKEDGGLFISELNYSRKRMSGESCYKVGFYYHTGYSEKHSETEQLSVVFTENYGFYMITDHILARRNRRSVGIFSQLAYSPSSINTHHLYIGLGTNIKGLFKQKPDVEIGTAIAFADFKNQTNHTHETIFELYCNIPLFSNFYVQPDMQYVLNPLGTEMELNNALVGMLRFGFLI